VVNTTNVQIKLTNIGKRYNYEWIFRKVEYEFTNEHNYVILGANGSGKSTLLQVIAGNLMSSEGDIKYEVSGSKYQDLNAVSSSATEGRSSRAESRDENKTAKDKNQEIKKIIEIEDIFSHLSFAAPYLELFEEFTLTESIEFQAQFKPFSNNLSTKQIVELTQLEKSQDKQIKYYSSGMKQRVRLALAVLADTPLLLLDEPTSNLDKKAIDWYQKLVDDFSKDRLIIVASNQQEYEYPFCNKQLIVEDYK
jgi:ABC-type multidrug transport system ATPase subunit